MINRLKKLIFQNHDQKQTIAKNIFWLSFSQVGSRLIRAGIIIYAARILGAAEYGIFSYVLGFAGFFTLFADIGVNSLLTRNIANQPEKKDDYFSASFWIKIFLLLFTALLIFFVAPHFTNIEKAKILIPFVAFLVIFDGVRELAIAYLRGIERMEREAFIIIIMNIAIFVVGFFILNIAPNSKSLIFSYIASVGLSAGLAIFMIRNQFLKVFRLFNKNLIRETLRNCWPIAFSGMFGVLMLNTDIIMLGWWRSAEEIGYYSAGQKIIQALYVIPALLAIGIFPALSRLIKQKNQEKERSLNENSMIIAFLIAIPLVIGGLILSQPIFELIFGKEYLASVPVFQILIFTIILIFPGIFLSNLIIARNQQKRVVGFMATGSFANIFLNVLLIPAYGIIGSAIATIFSMLLNYGLTWHHLKKINNFYTFRYLKKIILSAIIMGIFSFLLNKSGLNVVLNIIASAVIYFTILYFFKEKILNELKLFLWR